MPTHQQPEKLDSYHLRDVAPDVEIAKIATGTKRFNKQPSPDVKLYHFPTSTCSQRVRLAAAEKGVPYQSMTFDFFSFENLKPEYLSLNPRGVVPTWVDPDYTVFDSPTIIRFIDSYYDGPQLRPSDSATRADVETMIDSGDFFPNRYLTYFQQYEIAGGSLDGIDVKKWGDMLVDRCGSLKEDFPEMAPLYEAKIDDWNSFFAEIQDKDFMTRTIDFALSSLDDLDDRLADKPYLCSDEYTLADTCWTTSLLRLESYHQHGVRVWFDSKTRPHLRHYVDRLKKRASFQEAYVKHFQNLTSLLSDNAPEILRTKFAAAEKAYGAN